MSASFIDIEREDVSWHDCYAWAMLFNTDDAELSFSIDFLTSPPEGERSQGFWIAPAVLTFHGVTDLEIDIHSGDGRRQISLMDFSIDRIERTPVKVQLVYLDQPYYSWAIHFNMPPDGLITFGAVGCTQQLLADPICTTRERLSESERRPLDSP